jgi:anaerobic selenocysteine-containing dehydrogenase
LAASARGLGAWSSRAAARTRRKATPISCGSTIRSTDQYNTTLYSLSDRYRGVFGQRDVVFLNEYELSKRGLADGDRVDLITASTDGAERIVRNFRVVAYSFPTGCCAAYYPETNPLVPLYARDPLSFTPSYKGVPIRLVRSASSGR